MSDFLGVSPPQTPLESTISPEYIAKIKRGGEFTALYTLSSTGHTYTYRLYPLLIALRMSDAQIFVLTTAIHLSVLYFQTTYS